MEFGCLGMYDEQKRDVLLHLRKQLASRDDKQHRAIDTISIKVVENGKTSFFSSVLLDLFTVIWLWSWWAESESLSNMLIEYQ